MILKTLLSTVFALSITLGFRMLVAVRVKFCPAMLLLKPVIVMPFASDTVAEFAT